ncbi:MAG: GNAT family N-acetyltransferase [Gallionella sp.]
MLVTANTPLSYRIASLTDVKAIATLVNSAYRGESSRAGWTTEADLLDGQRTDVTEICRLIDMRDSLFLLCLSDDVIIGSVHLQKLDEATANLGMLVILPVLQGRGLGKRFIREAEELALARWEATRIQISVITLRKELIAFYERLGYCQTGEVKPFPDDPRFGILKVPSLNFEVLEKLF